MDCTAPACPMPNSLLAFEPSLPASIILLSAFCLLVVTNVLTAFRYKTPLYSSCLIVGLLVEILGFATRILLREDSTAVGFFAIYMASTIIGPTFISASIYMTLPHLMVIYGQGFSLVARPLYLNIFFLAFDVFTLAFQGVGVWLAVSGTSQSDVLAVRSLFSPMSP